MQKDFLWTILSNKLANYFTKVVYMTLIIPVIKLLINNLLDLRNKSPTFLNTVTQKISKMDQASLSVIYFYSTDFDHKTKKLFILLTSLSMLLYSQYTLEIICYIVYECIGSILICMDLWK